MTIRAGMIGCGGIANMHMKGYGACADVKVVACSDIDGDRAKKFAAAHGIAKPYDSYKKMLEKEKLDAVSICTPNYAHCDPTVMALRKGIHVLCEKPIAMNADEALSMVEASRAGRALLSIGHHMRFMPAAKFLKSRIDSGDLGAIYYGRSHALRRRGVPGWGAFHIKGKSGGGPLIDIGVHALDLILWLMGSPEPTTVSGTAYTKLGNRPDFHCAWGTYRREEYDVEDFACALVRFTNGATLTLEASWAAHLPVFETWPQMVLGEKGGAQLNPVGGDAPLRMFTSREGALLDITPHQLGEVEPHVEEVKHWVACVRGEAQVLVRGEESLNVQRILDGIYLSSERGAEVNLEKEIPGAPMDAGKQKKAPRRK
jgi:predicted dehydrogenase